VILPNDQENKAMPEQMIKPYQGDPFVGHLATPVSDSPLTRAFISNLPAYRKGLSPFRRGLEIGMAHGYLLLGPWLFFGPLRGTDQDLPAALLSTLGLIVILSIALRAYGIATFQSTPKTGDQLQTAKGWSAFSTAFFIGAAGIIYVNPLGLQLLNTQR
jgi:photosystem I subunit XI